jgi:hypothetical protein
VTTYQTRAQGTKSRRQARGHYSKPSAEMRKYIAQGVASLNEEEKTVVRAELAAMRISINW